MVCGMHMPSWNAEKVQGDRGVEIIRRKGYMFLGRNLYNWSEKKIRDTNEDILPELKTNKQANIKQQKLPPQQRQLWRRARTANVS